MWDNGRRNIKLDKAVFIDMGEWTRDSRFNMEAYTFKKVLKVCLNGWLKYLSKDGLLKLIVKE